MTFSDACVFCYRVALSAGILLIIAVYGNAIAKTAAMTHHRLTNSVAHLSPVERDANASGSGFSSLPGSLATYSGEDK